MKRAFRTGWKGRKVRVEVEQPNIDNAMRWVVEKSVEYIRDLHNPVAYAIRAHMPAGIRFNLSRVAVTYYDMDGRLVGSCDLTVNTRNQVRMWDEGKEIKPFNFYLYIPRGM
jgi:hypothetical protein